MEYFPRAGRLAQGQCRSSEPRPAEGDVGIENGRTAVLGGYVARCENCAHTLIACNACRNRHCPKCQRASPKAWLAARQAASIQGPKKGLGRLKAYKHLPVLKAVLAAHAGKHALSKNIERQANAA